MLPPLPRAFRAAAGHATHPRGAGNLPPPSWPPDRGDDSATAAAAALPPSGHRPAKTRPYRTYPARTPTRGPHNGLSDDDDDDDGLSLCVYAVPLRVFPTEIVFTFPSRTETPCPVPRLPEAGTRLFSVFTLIGGPSSCETTAAVVIITPAIVYGGNRATVVNAVNFATNQCSGGREIYRAGLSPRRNSYSIYVLDTVPKPGVKPLTAALRDKSLMFYARHKPLIEVGI